MVHSEIKKQLTEIYDVVVELAIEGTGQYASELPPGKKVCLSSLGSAFVHAGDAMRNVDTPYTRVLFSSVSDLSGSLDYLHSVGIVEEWVCKRCSNLAIELAGMDTWEPEVI